MLSRARIIKASKASAAQLALTAATKTGARIAPRAVVDAHAAAAQIRDAAKAEAAAQLSTVNAQKERILAQSRQDGFAQGVSEATAACIALARLEATKDVRELDRTVKLAHLLAERLLGQALQIDDAVVVQLAKQALSEVRGASQIRMEVSAADELILSANLQALDVPSAAVELCVDPTLSAGNFRLQTNVGTLEASLGSRLEMLSKKLREGLST